MCIMISRDTKLINCKVDFVAWNFCIMRQDLPYKWHNLLQFTKVVI